MNHTFTIFQAFLKLGCTCFGGPAAHIGYFRRELVERRKWITETAFSELWALSQLLPGPSSSQTGFLIGIARGGLVGGAAAWLGFTLPSALLMTAFGVGLKYARGPAAIGALRGLQLAAIAVVANAVVIMFRRLCPDWPRRMLAVASAFLLFFSGSAFAEIAVLIAGASAGLLFFRSNLPVIAGDDPLPVSRRAAAACFGCFAFLFAGLEFAARQSPSVSIRFLDAFYRTGALVFGGGHVVLPLLSEAVVRPGWVSASDFLAGYGAAQTLPGPLFSFAAYLGFVGHTPLHGIGGAFLCTCCIFLPGLLLAAAVAPFWSWLRKHRAAQFAIAGVNAVVVGLLMSALFHAAASGAIHNLLDTLMVLLAFLVLLRTQISPVTVVLSVSLLSAIYSTVFVP